MIDKHSANGWNRIGSIRSASNPAKVYVVAERTGGAVGCNCPSWVFKRGTKAHDGHDRTCKHIRTLLDESVPLLDLDLTPFGIGWLMKRREAKGAAKVAKAG